jgi:TRAP-type C4-dicarboxylate transport system permease large subunit
MAIALVITGRIADVDQLRVFRANMPFLWGMLGFLILIMAVPQLATWLPGLLRN